MNDRKPTPPGLPLSGEELVSIDGGGSKDGEGVSTLQLPADSSPDKGRPGAGGVKGFITYDKRLTALDRENRKNPTAPEIKMWNEVLRMRHFVDYKFLRQKPIADFIVNFYCAELHLAIEIDGDSHAEAVGYDAKRTAILNTHGISVVRYTNNEVMRNIEGVYDDLLCKLERQF